jgi:CoA-transferase family III
MGRRVIELGSYVIPAYAGMVLAEQGFAVEKWHVDTDPILGLREGEKLWRWINHGKRLERRHARDVVHAQDCLVIDNFRPATLERWGLDPAELARTNQLVWVSMRSEVGERSFDIVAQARAWGGIAPYIPFYIGDTAGGLWLAFKVLAVAHRPGHYVLGQSSCLSKLVEGELTFDTARDGKRVPWESVETYSMNERGASVHYRGERIEEPLRDSAWRLKHLWHDGQGRIRI